MAGNANSGNRTGLPRPREDRPFFHALRREMAKAAAGEDTAYNQLARKLMAEASKGEAWAIKELIDRLDGKAIQQTENHNINEHVFAEVPETMPREQWDSLTAGQSGKPKSARNGH